MSTLQEIAQKALEQFERRTKQDGSGKEAWFLKEGHEEWVQDMVREAHDDLLLPDDWKYAFIVEALDALAEYDDEEEARDSLEADVYTHALLQWLSSNLNRPGYCDEVSEEYGIPAHEFQGGIVALIMEGQLREKQETFDSVVFFLQDKLLEEDV